MEKLLKYFFFLFSLSIQAQNSNDFEKPEGTTIKYGFDKSYEPYEYVDIQGVYTGFNIELIEGIARELNLNLQLYPDIWRNTRRNLEYTKEINVAAYFYSAERESIVSYSDPISVVYYSIFTRKEGESVEDLFNLVGKKVAIQELTIVDDYFNQLGFLNLDDLQKYSSEEEAIEAVLNGKSDCAITSFMTTNYLMDLGKIKDIRSSSDPVFITEYCYVVNKKDSALLDSLNWGLRLVKASGEYDKIYQKWLIPKKSWWEVNSHWIIFFIIGFVLLCFIVGSYILILKKQIKKKTSKIAKTIEAKLVAESSLNQSESLRRKIEAFSSVIMLEVSLDHKIIRAPKLFHSLLEYDEDAIIGSDIYSLMTSNSITLDREIKKDLLKGDFKFLDSEIELKTFSKQRVWVECSTSVRYSKDLKPVGFLQFMLDITLLKAANLNLKELNAELANFMYKTSHDVRGPIANTLGLANLGIMKAPDEEILQLFTLIRQSTSKLENIFDDFKEVSLILHGNVNVTTFDIKLLIEEVLETIFRKRDKDINSAQIEVDVNLASNFISSDRTLVKRLIFQIIENAFEHNTYYETKFTITINNRGSAFYQIIFEDNGIGIPEEIHEKVFEVFFKGKRSDINIGMGLYIAKKVMNRLGGTLNLDSEINRGTRIEVLLPVKQFNKVSFN